MHLSIHILKSVRTEFPRVLLLTMTCVLLLFIKFATLCSVDLLCLLNCITETLQVNEDCKRIPRGPGVGQPWVGGLGVPQIWSTLCEENMSPLVVNQTPFSCSIHSDYDKYYLHISSRGPWVSDQLFLALHLKAVSMFPVQYQMSPKISGN